jgi:hypothetical protein
MTNHVIKVTFKNGESRCDPLNELVTAGDTVQWKCDDGDLEIDFPGETPFTSMRVWSAPRGQPTSPAMLKSNNPAGTLPRPTFRVNGQLAVHSFGDVEFH